MITDICLKSMRVLDGLMSASSCFVLGTSVRVCQTNTCRIKSNGHICLQSISCNHKQRAISSASIQPVHHSSIAPAPPPGLMHKNHNSVPPFPVEPQNLFHHNMMPCFALQCVQMYNDRLATYPCDGLCCAMLPVVSTQRHRA